MASLSSIVNVYHRPEIVEIPSIMGEELLCTSPGNGSGIGDWKDDPDPIVNFIIAYAHF